MVGVVDREAELALEQRASWADRVQVVAWPSMEPVETTLSYGAPPPNSDDIHRLGFEPREAFGSGGYAAIVSLRETGGRRVTTDSLGLPDDRWTARFRTDSHPITVSIGAGTRGASTLVDIEFSERVITDGPTSAALFVDGRSVECGLITRFVDREGAREAQSRLVWTCPTRAAGALELRSPDGLATIHGTPAYGLGDRTPAVVRWERDWREVEEGVVTRVRLDPLAPE